MNVDQYYDLEHIKFFETNKSSEYYALVKAKDEEEAKYIYQRDIAEIDDDEYLGFIEIPMREALGKYMEFVIEEGSRENMYIGWVSKDLKIHMEHVMSKQAVPLLIDKSIV